MPPPTVQASRRHCVGQVSRAESCAGRSCSFSHTVHSACNLRAALVPAAEHPEASGAPILLSIRLQGF